MGQCPQTSKFLREGERCYVPLLFRMCSDFFPGARLDVLACPGLS